MGHISQGNKFTYQVIYMQYANELYERAAHLTKYGQFVVRQ